MPSLPPADTSSILILPLHSHRAIRDPALYLALLRRITRRTTDRLLVLCHGSAARRAGWTDIEGFLGVVYSAVAQEAARHGRVLFEVDVLVEGFAGDQRAGPEAGGARAEARPGASGGSVSFGSVEGKWDRVWVSDRENDGEEDRALLAACLQHLPDKSQVSTFPSQSIPPASRRSSKAETSAPHADTGGDTATHPVVAVGGTFDHLHAGHKILLSMCVWLATRKVIVGVSDDALLVNKSHASLLEPLAVRISRVRAFLERLNPRLELQVVPLHDVAGPTGWDADVQALVVSRESITGGEMIAGIRKEKGLPPLKQYVIDVITASPAAGGEDDVVPSRSTAESDDDHRPRLLADESDPARLKTLKLGSTYIREWLAQEQAGTSSYAGEKKGERK